MFILFNVCLYVCMIITVYSFNLLLACFTLLMATLNIMFFFLMHANSMMMYFTGLIQLSAVMMVIVLFCVGANFSTKTPKIGQKFITNVVFSVVGIMIIYFSFMWPTVNLKTTNSLNFICMTMAQSVESMMENVVLMVFVLFVIILILIVIFISHLLYMFSCFRSYIKK